MSNNNNKKEMEGWGEKRNGEREDQKQRKRR